MFPKRHEFQKIRHEFQEILYEFCAKLMGC